MNLVVLTEKNGSKILVNMGKIESAWEGNGYTHIHMPDCDSHMSAENCYEVKETLSEILGKMVGE